jgi:hypothetical protein
MDFEVNERRRDRRLRRRILRMLFNARAHARGGLHGRAISDLLATGVTDDEHLLGLLRDLQAGGYATLTDERTRPKMQGYGIDHLFAVITAKGVSLVNETAPRDPDIADDRDPEDE